MSESNIDLHWESAKCRLMQLLDNFEWRNDQHRIEGVIINEIVRTEKHFQSKITELEQQVRDAIKEKWSTYDTWADICNKRDIKITTLEQQLSSDRESLALWISSFGLSTGHGDTITDLINEADWQFKEMKQQLAQYELAAKKFIDKVDSGRAKSKETYADFKALLNPPSEVME